MASISNRHFQLLLFSFLCVSSLCSLPGIEYEEQQQMPNFVDPLRSIFIRQEAALRKLDAIIVKVSQVDSLESKLEGMQKLLEEQLEKNNVLETKLEVLEEKLLEHQLEQYKILEVKLETIETKLHERSLAVNHTLEVELEALATKLQENQLETNLMIENKLETIDVKLEDVLNAVKNTSLNCTEVGAQIMHTQEKLRETCQSNTDENEEVVTIFRNINETSSESLLNYTTDISHLSDKAMHEIKSFVENTVTNIIFPTHLRDNDAMGINTEISHKLTNLSDLITSHINITKHLFAATFNRIAVSNLAMDKRLGALLHTSSSRQRVLQDSLLTAIASLSPVIKTQTQEVIRKTESKLGSLELSLASSVKRHAKELATQVLEAANVTLNDVYMNTMARLTDLYQAHINQSLLLENNFNLMNELKNLTFHRQQSNENYDLCLDAIGEDDQNETTKYTLRALSRIEDVIRGQQAIFNHQVSVITEQLAGLRIYYSTSLHMHTDQVVSVMKNTQGEMTQVVKETLAKSTRHLEKLRRSSLGYLDAAVTSISSSAVASAQSTTMQLKEALKALDMHVGEKLHKLQSSMSQLVTVCPPKYTNVGGTCLLAFSDLLTTWETARQICHQERGDLILIPDAEMMNHLQVFVYSTHAKNTDVAPPYWVGARKRESQWWWLNECLVTLKISDATLPDTLQNINNTQNSTDNGDECLMSWGTGAELLRSSCDSLRAVLCQYQSHYANVTSEISNDQIIDEIKHSTEQPNIILEPDNNALNFDTQYDYLTYSFK